MRRLLPLLAAASLLVAAPRAFAGDDPAPEDEPNADGAPTAAPKAGDTPTTVIAPPGSDGVTVVAPTAHGGTVVGQGCRSVTVTGSPTVVEAGAQPLCPFKAPEPEIRYVYVERDSRPRFAPDVERGAAISLGAIALGVGSIFLGAWYVNSVSDEYHACENAHWSANGGSWNYGDSGCHATGGIGPLLAYTGLMSFAPTLARFSVGDTKGGWIFSAAIASSIALGKIIDASSSDVHDLGSGGFLLGYLVPATLGIVALATTPHREDLVENKGARVSGVSVVPVTGKTGTTGGMVALTGQF
jgi:hypothetical protein